MKSSLRIGVLASGRGSNLQAIIDSIESGQLHANLSMVISNKEGSGALARARKHRLLSEFVDPKLVRDDPDPRQGYDRIVLEVLQKAEVDLVLLSGYMKIVTPVLLRAYPWRIMNIHPSLLPSFPGLQAQKQALDAGVKVSGCTVHFVTEGVDEGPIILQSAVPVLEDDTEDSLAHRILQEEHVLFSKAIQLFAEKRLRVEGRTVKILATKH